MGFLNLSFIILLVFLHLFLRLFHVLLFFFSIQADVNEIGKSLREAAATPLAGGGGGGGGGRWQAG